MADLSKLSDEELSKIAFQPKQKDLSSVNDDELMKIAGQKSKPKEMGFIQSQVQQLPLYGAGLGGIAGAAGGGLLSVPIGGVGAVPGAVVGAAGGAGLGQSLKDIINRYAYDEKKGVADTLLDPAKAMVEGAAQEMGGQIVGKGASAVLGKFAKPAEKLAENATGATGKQIEKFRPGSGRELLDKKFVRFGDNAKNIAERVTKASDEAGDIINQSLKELDAGGAKASADNVVAALEKRVKDLKADPSQSKVVKELNSIIESIVETGNSEVNLTLAEQTKRGFRKAAGNWMNPEAGQAGKEAYLAYMKEVEEGAIKSNPALARKFQDAKKLFGILSPIEEAASRRAATLNQSPIGGLMDVATAGGTGMAVGGIPGIATGVGTAIGRRVLAPRISSSLAVTLDGISKADPQIVSRLGTTAVFQRRLEGLGKKQPKK